MPQGVYQKFNTRGRLYGRSDAMNLPIELCFNVRGTTLPVDNGYPLYAAISTALDGHLPEGVGVIPIRSPRRAGEMLIFQHEYLRIRTPHECIPLLLQLSGKPIEVHGHPCAIGSPRVFSLQPSHALYSPFVTFKNSLTEAKFAEVVARKLEQMDIKAKITIPLDRWGKPRRLVRSIRGDKIVGFALQLDELSEKDSLKLLHEGLGGRRHMGGGIFFSRRK